MDLSATDRTTTDEILVRRSQSGDKGAFDALVTKYRAAIYRVAYGMLLNVADAEDVTQEVFVRAYRSIRRCDTKKGFERWLYGIAVNRCRSRAAAKAKEGAALTPDPDGHFAANPGEEVADLAVKRETRDQVRRAIARLPARQKAALVLFEMRGLSLSETSRAMGCSLGAVKSYVHKGRAHLRRELSQIVEEE